MVGPGFLALDSACPKINVTAHFIYYMYPIVPYHVYFENQFFLLQKIKKYDKFKTWHSVQSFLLALLEVGVLGCTLAFNVIKNWIITRVIFFFANDPCVVTSHLQFNFKKI